MGGKFIPTKLDAYADPWEEENKPWHGMDACGVWVRILFFLGGGSIVIHDDKWRCVDVWILCATCSVVYRW